MTDLIVFALLFTILIAINIPIAFVLGIVGAYALTGEGFSDVVIIRQMYHGLDSFALMAIPFFIFAGQIMNKGQITDKLLDLSEALVGWIRGSLGHVNIVASILFAGVSGAAVSDSAALGSMLIPAMEKKGYSRSYSAALTAASSIIGPTIPPSIPMIVYGASNNISIAGLFAGGILPGLGLGFIMMIINYIIVKRRNYEPSFMKDKIDHYDNKVYGFTLTIIKYLKNILVKLKSGVFALIMFIIIFGGILGGVFTATEAAGVAVLYAILITIFVIKTIKPFELFELLKETGSMIGLAMLIVGTGRIISHYFTMAGIPTMLANYITDYTNSPIVFMFICAIFLLFIGTFMDLIASIIILGPILTPIAISFGIHPIHFGLVFILSLNVALITPPVGGVLFVVSAVGKTSFESIVKEIIPFYISFAIMIILIITFEPITVFIPRLLGLI